MEWDVRQGEIDSEHIGYIEADDEKQALKIMWDKYGHLYDEEDDCLTYLFVRPFNRKAHEDNKVKRQNEIKNLKPKKIVCRTIEHLMHEITSWLWEVECNNMGLSASLKAFKNSSNPKHELERVEYWEEEDKIGFYCPMAQKTLGGHINPPRIYCVNLKKINSSTLKELVKSLDFIAQKISKR